jgi:5-methylcytosine-specific restriction endonuclease McrA
MSNAQRKASNARTLEWRRNNPFFRKSMQVNARARKRGITGRVYAADIAECWAKWGGLCWVCGDEASELDHFRPVGRGAGGTNTPDNLRPICRECNHKRSQQWRGNAMAEQEANLLKQIKILLHGKHTPARTVQGVVGSLDSET